MASFVSFLWLHGGILFFWDETLPIFPYYELTHFTYIWSPFGLGVINSHSNQNFSYYILWTIFYFISFKFLPLAEQLLIFVIFMISGLSSFLLLKFIFNKLSTNNTHNYLALVGSLFYMFNYYSAFSFYEIEPYWIGYALLPVAIYIFFKGLTKVNSNINVIKYAVLSSFLFEIIFSFTFYLSPMVVFMLFIFLFYYVVFRKRITLSNITKREIYYLLSTLLTIIILNSWWLTSFIDLVNSNTSGSTRTTILSGVRHQFLFPSYKLSFWSAITLYPRLYPLKYNNGYQFIGQYSSVYSIFFIISVIFFIIILIPLINIKKNSLLTKKEKIALYSILFILISFAIQGINPLNRLIFYLMTSLSPSLLPYLYATNYIFIEVPIIMIYIILVPIGIYEIANFKVHSKIEQTIKKYPKSIKKIMKNKRKIVSIFIVFLIIGIYPYYMYTPEATMVYFDGHNTVPSVVNFPPYFYKLLNYIHTNSNGSTTLILPQSYGFFSINFTKNNMFADDEQPSYLTGTEMLLYNSSIDKKIQQFISDDQPSYSHFSFFLNNINVKYIIVDTNVSQYIHGYGGQNSTKILNYINSRANLTPVARFGPILLYKNNNYEGLIYGGKYNNDSKYLVNPTSYTNTSYVFGNRNYTNQSGPVPKLSYYKVSPVHYKINVYNSNSNFTLLFKQNYNVGWVLSLENGNKIPNHFIADGYGNGWIINKTGNFTLNLYFAPQKRVSSLNDIFLFINATLFILLLTIFVYSRRRKIW